MTQQYDQNDEELRQSVTDDGGAGLGGGSKSAAKVFMGGDVGLEA